MGQLFAIPQGTSIASLGLTSAAGRAIATAVQTYGAYVADTGGALSFYAEPGAQSAHRSGTWRRRHSLDIRRHEDRRGVEVRDEQPGAELGRRRHAAGSAGAAVRVGARPGSPHLDNRTMSTTNEIDPSVPPSGNWLHGVPGRRVAGLVATPPPLRGVRARRLLR